MSRNLPSARAALVLMNRVSLGSGMTVCHQLKNTESHASLEFSLQPQLLGRERKYWKLCYQSIMPPQFGGMGGCEHYPCVRRSCTGFHSNPCSGYLWPLAAFVYSLYKRANVVKCFHKFWKPVSQLLDLDSWCLKLVQRPYPVEVTVTVTTTTPGQCAIGTGWLDSHQVSVEHWKTDHVKRILAYRERYLYSQEIVCFPIQWYPKRQTEVETTATERWLERLVMGLL